LAIVAFANWSSPASLYLLAGALLYIVGSVLVTIMSNVPPNNRLKAVSAGSPEAPICGAHI
jgi:uncharacterized membrane protein